MKQKIAWALAILLGIVTIPLVLWCILYRFAWEMAAELLEQLLGALD